MNCVDCGSPLVYDNGEMVYPACLLLEAQKHRCKYCVFFDANRSKWHCLWYKEGKQPKPEKCTKIVWSK